MGLTIAVTPGEVMHVTKVSEQLPIEQALSRASDFSVHNAREWPILWERPHVRLSHAVDTWAPACLLSLLPSLYCTSHCHQQPTLMPASVWMSVKIFRFLRILPLYPTLKRIQSSSYWFRSVGAGVCQGAIDLIFCSFGSCARAVALVSLFKIGYVAQWVTWRGSSQ
jgi:hypothetical protein